VAVDDQSEISFSIPGGTLPRQPSFVGSFYRVEFRRQSAGGVSLRQKALLIRWTQAASGTAGRAKRRALPCVCLQTVCCVGGRLWCCEDYKYRAQISGLIYQISYDYLTIILRLCHDNAKVTNYDRLTTDV